MTQTNEPTTATPVLEMPEQYLARRKKELSDAYQNAVELRSEGKPLDNQTLEDSFRMFGIWWPDFESDAEGLKKAKEVARAAWTKERKEEADEQRRKAEDAWRKEVSGLITARLAVVDLEHLGLILETSLQKGAAIDEGMRRRLFASRPGVFDGLVGTPATHNRNARNAIEGIKNACPRIKDRLNAIQSGIEAFYVADVRAL